MGPCLGRGGHAWILLTQISDSVATSPTDHHSPKGATSLDRYLCHCFPFLTSWGTEWSFTWEPRYTLSRALGEHCLVGFQSPCTPGDLPAVHGNTSNVPKANSKLLLVIPGTESCLLPCCLCQECLKAILFLSPAKPSSSCPAMSACHALAVYRTPVK